MPRPHPLIKHREHRIAERRIVGLRVELDVARRRFDRLAKTFGHRLQSSRIVERPALLVPGMQAPRRHQERGRTLGLRELGADVMRETALLLRRHDSRGDEAVVGVIGPVLVLLRRPRPGLEVDHVGRARRDDLRNTRLARRLEPRRARIDERAIVAVAGLADAQIEHGREAFLLGEALDGPTAHAGAVEDGDLVAAALQRRLQANHVVDAALAERAHADQRPLRLRLRRGLGRADDGTGRLAQHRLADRVEAIEPARPQDHHEIGRQPLRRNEMREGHRRDDEFRHAHRQRGGNIEREVRAHGAAQRDHAVDFALHVELQGQRRRALGHLRHRLVLVAHAGRSRRWSCWRPPRRPCWDIPAGRAEHPAHPHP